MNAAEIKMRKILYNAFIGGEIRCNKYNKKWLSWQEANAKTERFLKKSKIF